MKNGLKDVYIIFVP